LFHSRNQNHFSYNQVFGEWLHTKSEFKYIIDGANVAYHHQNFNDGKFSYKQIELLVDKMLERGDGKVLVLLPAVYSRHSIPNKCCSKSGQKYRMNKRSTISEDDKVCNIIYIYIYIDH
jgi:Zc3h12a-like Ribonuclease NYN domain